MAHLDLNFIRQNVTDDPEFIKQLLGVFLSSVERDVDALRADFINEDAQQIKLSAHKVKSSFRSLGMTHLTQLLQSIEDDASQNLSIEVLKERLQLFEAILPEAIQEVNQALKEHQ